VERTVWTDERLDDAITRIDQRFDRLDRNFDRVWDEFRELRGQIAASNRQLALIGWALVGILFVQLIAALVAFS
jgi:tetrahydromethanopterin S-methyltransferase subunit G